MWTSGVCWKPAFAFLHGNTLQGVFNVILCLLPFGNLIQQLFFVLGSQLRVCGCPADICSPIQKSYSLFLMLVRLDRLRVVYQ